MSSGNEIVEQLIRRLGLYDEKHLITKSNELLRRLDNKSFEIVSKCGDYAKTMLCIDLSGTSLGLQIDQKTAIKISGMGTTEYSRNKRTFEKILDVSQAMDISRICIQLGISQVQKSAEKLFEWYKMYMQGNEEIDLSHPQYACMAIYQACRLEKIKVLRSKVIKISHLKNIQWEKLEKSWNLILEKAKIFEDRKITSNENKIKKSSKSTVIQPIDNYEIWKEKLLHKSYNDLVKTKRINFIDIYLLSFIHEFDLETVNRSIDILKILRQISDVHQIYHPKYSSIALFLALKEKEIVNIPIEHLQNYCKCSAKEWNSIIKSYEEYNSQDNKENSTMINDLDMVYEEFQTWQKNFIRS